MLCCIHCGRKVKAGASYCPYCGHKIIKPRTEVPISRGPPPALREVKFSKEIGMILEVIVLLIALVMLVTFFEHEVKKTSPIERELAKVPQGYYSTNSFPNYRNTASDLDRFLTSGFKLPSNYRTGVFDCSESAAYVEWALEDAGFKASIAVSRNCPWASAGHAWVIVYTTDGYRVAIESTALSGYGLWEKIKHFFTGGVNGIVYEGDQYAYYYYSPHYVFPTIYDAIKYSPTAGEWDWWLGSWGFV